MRIRIIGFMLVAFSLIILSGCKKKYPENTFGSFERPTTRLVENIWYLDVYLVDGVVDNLYKGQKYKETYSELCGTGVKCDEGSTTSECLLFELGKSYYWKLSDDENSFKRTEVGSSGGLYDEITIVKLTNRAYWYSFEKNGIKYEFRFKK